jgi:hypothetical protein
MVMIRLLFVDSHFPQIFDLGGTVCALATKAMNRERIIFKAQDLVGRQMTIIIIIIYVLTIVGVKQ